MLFDIGEQKGGYVARMNRLFYIPEKCLKVPLDGFQDCVIGEKTILDWNVVEFVIQKFLIQRNMRRAAPSECPCHYFSVAFFLDPLPESMLI